MPERVPDIVTARRICSNMADGIIRAHALLHIVARSPDSLSANTRANLREAAQCLLCALVEPNAHGLLSDGTPHDIADFDLFGEHSDVQGCS